MLRELRGFAQNGFSYLIVLFAIAALGAALGVAGQVWHTASVREKERQLLYVGNAFRDAIASYYERSPSGAKSFPKTFDELVKDPRFPNTMRHLRKIYPDPITGKEDWGLIPAPGGGIMGVYSKSEARPLKVAYFDAPYQAFAERALQLKEKMTYAQWQFAYGGVAVPGTVALPATSARQVAAIAK